MKGDGMGYGIDEKARYTKTHEWVRLEGGEATVGISDYAQHSLSDVVFVELPAAGAALRQGAAFATVESVKAAEEVFSPITGTVTAVNPALAKTPELLNKDPFGQGWLLKARPADPAELESLMDAGAYAAYLDSL
jgi:glycine cleavage system H protein